jgi:hypothetical protein
MGIYFIAGGAGLEKPWPKYSGKAFVLWLVASNKLDRRDARQLEILFSPADAARSLAKAGGVEAYAKLTLEALKQADPARGALTSYAGRRNAEREHVLTAEEQSRMAAILADLSLPDGAIVGFAGGSAADDPRGAWARAERPDRRGEAAVADPARLSLWTRPSPLLLHTSRVARRVMRGPMRSQSVGRARRPCGRGLARDAEEGVAQRALVKEADALRPRPCLRTLRVASLTGGAEPARHRRTSVAVDSVT